MRIINITEEEKRGILGLHGSKLIKEQNKTILDIQKLVGAYPDNYLGPETLAKIQKKLAEKGTKVSVAPVVKDLSSTGSASATAAQLANVEPKKEIVKTTSTATASKETTAPDQGVEPKDV